MQSLKQSSSKWMKCNEHFAYFEGWGKERKESVGDTQPIETPPLRSAAELGGVKKRIITRLGRRPYTAAKVHIVINTRFRKRTIPEAYKKELYMYMYGIIQNNKCKLLRMNGIANHIHMLVDLHPSISLSSLMQSLKQSAHSHD